MNLLLVSRTHSGAVVADALIIAIPTMQVSRHCFTETRDSPDSRLPAVFARPSLSDVASTLGPGEPIWPRAGDGIGLRS
jgi:hypothetical protein